MCPFAITDLILQFGRVDGVGVESNIPSMAPAMEHLSPARRWHAAPTSRKQPRKVRILCLFTHQPLSVHPSNHRRLEELRTKDLISAFARDGEARGWPFPQCRDLLDGTGGKGHRPWSRAARGRRPSAVEE